MIDFLPPMLWQHLFLGTYPRLTQAMLAREIEVIWNFCQS